MMPGETVHIVDTLRDGRAFYEGQATLVEQVYQLWWKVRFADGVIAKRRIEPDAQDDPRAWVQRFNNPEGVPFQ